MIALAAALFMQAAQPNPFQDLIPSRLPPCRSGAPSCAPWERQWGMRWVRFFRTNQGSIYSYDTESVVRDGDQIRLWVTMDHSQDTTINARTTRGMLIIYCRDRKFRWESLASFDERGSQVHLFESYTPLDNIPPETGPEAMWRDGCSTH